MQDLDTHCVGKTWTAWEGYTNMGIEGGTLAKGRGMEKVGLVMKLALKNLTRYVVLSLWVSPQLSALV